MATVADFVQYSSSTGIMLFFDPLMQYFGGISQLISVECEVRSRFNNNPAAARGYLVLGGKSTRGRPIFFSPSLRFTSNCLLPTPFPFLFLSNYLLHFSFAHLISKVLTHVVLSDLSESYPFFSELRTQQSDPQFSVPLSNQPNLYRLVLKDLRDCNRLFQELICSVTPLIRS